MREKDALKQSLCGIIVRYEHSSIRILAQGTAAVLEGGIPAHTSTGQAALLAVGLILKVDASTVRTRSH